MLKNFRIKFTLILTGESKGIRKTKRNKLSIRFDSSNEEVLSGMERQKKIKLKLE